MHTVALAGGEPVHAGVVGVGHEVVDRVVGAAGAAVDHGTTEVRTVLRLGVVDEVARRAAAPLEGVEEAQPVADLVGGRVALTVGRGPAGERVVLDHDPVDHRGARVILGKRRPAEQGGEVDDVEIECPRAALVERRLHRRFLGRVDFEWRPGGVDGHVGIDQLEHDPGVVAAGAAAEGGVENADLALDPRRGNDADPGAVLDHVHVDGHPDRPGRACPSPGGLGRVLESALERVLVRLVDVRLDHARLESLLRDPGVARRFRTREPEGVAIGETADLPRWRPAADGAATAAAVSSPTQ